MERSIRFSRKVTLGICSASFESIFARRHWQNYATVNEIKNNDNMQQDLQQNSIQNKTRDLKLRLRFNMARQKRAQAIAQERRDSLSNILGRTNSL